MKVNISEHPVKWQKKQFEIMNRDMWTCTNCGDKESELVIFPKKKLLYNSPLDYPDELLITLCSRCGIGHSYTLYREFPKQYDKKIQALTKKVEDIVLNSKIFDCDNYAVWEINTQFRVSIKKYQKTLNKTDFDNFCGFIISAIISFNNSLIGYSGYIICEVMDTLLQFMKPDKAEHYAKKMVELNSFQTDLKKSLNVYGPTSEEKILNVKLYNFFRKYITDGNIDLTIRYLTKLLTDLGIEKGDSQTVFNKIDSRIKNMPKIGGKKTD